MYYFDSTNYSIFNYFLTLINFDNVYITSLCSNSYVVRLELNEGGQGKLDSVEALLISYGTLVTGEEKS